MSIHSIKINSTDVNTLIGDAPINTIAGVPSTMMRTPSSEFARAFETLTNVGLNTAKVLTTSPTTSSIIISDIKGFLKSSKGLHLIEQTNSSTITIDLTTADATYDIYVSVVFNDNDTIKLKYPLDEIQVESVATGTQPANTNAIIIATVTVASGVVSNIVDKVDITEFTADKSNIIYGISQPSATINPKNKKNAFYYDTNLNDFYLCIDATENANVWKKAGTGQFYDIGTDKGKSIGYTASETDAGETIIKAGTNSFSIDTLIIPDGGSLIIEDGATHKVL